MRFVLAFACIAAIVSAAAVAAPQKARIVLTASAPASFHGMSFKPLERITVTVTTTVTRKKVVTANRSGAFRTTFTGLVMPRCESYTVVARGNRGSVATLKIIPECPPPSPSPSEQPLVPVDPKGGH